jgi:hypothetical protein
MLKKPIHNHKYNQTNPKPQPKPKTKPKKQPPTEPAHTKHLQQQPKRKHYYPGPYRTLQYTTRSLCKAPRERNPKETKSFLQKQMNFFYRTGFFQNSLSSQQKPETLWYRFILQI